MNSKGNQSWNKNKEIYFFMLLKNPVFELNSWSTIFDLSHFHQLHEHVLFKKVIKQSFRKGVNLNRI